MPSRRSRRIPVGIALVVAALAAVSGLSTPAHAAGTVLYVSPSGSDANSGTSAGAPFQTIQKALDLAQPGTTITLAAGTYRQALVTRVAGTANAPITIKGPETGKAVSGRYKAVVYSVGGRVFSINHSYYTLDGFTIDGQPSIARSEYPTSLSAVRSWKDSVQARAVNSKLVYVGADVTVADIAGTTIRNMFLNGSGGECVRFRDRAADSIIDDSVIQYCGVLGQGNDVDQYRYHNAEGVYVGTSPKSTDQPMAANDTSHGIVVRNSTINTFGAECFEVKENAHDNRLENTDCGFNDEPLSFKGSNIELRGDHNLVLSSRVTNSRSWNVKLASDTPAYDRGGNTIQKSSFGGAASGAPAILDQQTGPGSSFCGNTFATQPAGSGLPVDPTRPCADTTAPTAPANLAARASSPTAVGLTWTAATDDVGVASYSVSRNGTAVGTTTGTSYTDSGLAAGTPYTYAVVARDAAGNASPAATASVTTPAVPTDTTPPTVTARTPAAGATGVATGTPVTATFSEPVTGVTGSTFVLKAGSTGVPAAVTYNATTRVATLTPTAALAANTAYTASVTTGIADAARNPLVSASWTFTTAAAADRTAPTVTARSPGSGATNVSRSGNVTVTFSEPVTGVSTGTFVLRTSGGSTVTASVARVGTTNQWVLDPGPTLSSRATYTVTLTGGSGAIRDVAGNPLTTVRWSFTTAR